ncbi:hypothetical protein [Aequorivita viscosa]|uniref:NlpE C-terminal OB domain-containing protein n=1 Tax=Aequorivita viscosa TaxID=797419 RepID=A0A1M6BMY8_9FLAO|nr:hypothetical protein [Aequorivita viscosa]SDW18644.1 hypothetical protein SAMN05216556_1039 [Aequorivita viscosa]SHI50092.1 hypothetical protein SAMN04487908_1039 [Aequorivita viscosa]
MKRILLLLMFSTLLYSCNNTKTENEALQTENTEAPKATVKTYEGEFIYTPEAAVFKGNSFVYGVQINDKAKDLAEKVAAVKKGEFDMVPVVVRGEVTPKPEGTDGWDEIITITEIINVSETSTKADVELKAN